MNKLKITISIIVFNFIFLVACKNGASSPPPMENVSTEEKSENKEIVLNEAQYKNANIELGTFSMKNLSEVINANGYTKVPPQHQADVTAFVGGIIKTINVIEGNYVKKGQTLATLQSLEYNNIRLEKAKLTEQLQASQSNKSYLDIEFARQKELSDENVNAKKIFQKVAADLDFETRKITNLQNQIAILDQNLQIGGSSQSPILSITAPISGFVTAIEVKIGSTAEVGKPLFSIVENSEMHVDLMVYEKDLFKLKVGQNIRFVLTNQGSPEIMGKIFNIGKAFQTESKTVAVHADINNKVGLISGMYVNALIDIGSQNVAALPQTSIVKAEGKSFIFILLNENDPKEKKFQRIEVKTGTTQLGFTQVTPLQEMDKNAKIILNGAYYLQSSLESEE
jgi:membrane fusion protein, heavy metal efflux system